MCPFLIHCHFWYFVTDFLEESVALVNSADIDEWLYHVVAIVVKHQMSDFELDFLNDKVNVFLFELA